MRKANLSIVAAIFLSGLGSLNAQSFETNYPVRLIEDSRIAPSAPILITPSDHATGVRINAAFTWSSSSGALLYHLQVSTDSTFATAVIDKPALTDTTQHLIGLLHKTIYYWRVNASSDAGTSAFSATFNFRSKVASAIEEGEVQAATASIILRHVAGISILTGDDYDWADVSGDGTVSAYDAALVLQAASGLLSVYTDD